MSFGPEWFVVLPVLGFTAVWIWALVDAIGVREDAMYRSGSKLLWVLVIVFTGIIGAIIYFAVGRPVRGATPPTGPPAASSPALPWLSWRSARNPTRQRSTGTSRPEARRRSAYAAKDRWFDHHLDR